MTIATFTDGASDGLARAADQAAERVRSAGRSAARGLETIAGRVDAAAENAKAVVEAEEASVSQMIRDHPIRSLTGAAILGAVAGALILRRR